LRLQGHHSTPLLVHLHPAVPFNVLELLRGFSVWCMVCGVWCMVYGVWCMVCGYSVWCMVYGHSVGEQCVHIVHGYSAEVQCVTRV
jgi:hypothetical protein